MQNTSSGALNTSKLRELKKLAGSITDIGVNFAVCDVNGEIIQFRSGGQFDTEQTRLTEMTINILNQKEASVPASDEYGCHRQGRIIGVALGEPASPYGAVLIDAGPDYDTGCPQVDTVQHQQSACDNDKFGQTTPEMKSIKVILSIIAEKFDNDNKAETQIELVSTELAQTYEELVLLHKLSGNMKITRSGNNFLQMACNNITDIINVEGIAVFLQTTDEETDDYKLAAGAGIIDPSEELINLIHRRLAEQMRSGREALLDSEVDSPFRYQWPENIKNIIAVPLSVNGSNSQSAQSPAIADHSISLIGFMVAINALDKQDFDSVDVNLFNSVANTCAVFAENGRLFKDLKELFIGSLKALTSSIDAKDQYTRGHSERVAFISKWIAERASGQLNLSRTDIHKIYLAGLLHDIGKMGINEAILRKSGKLADEEFEHIHTHPSIGAEILSGMKQMKDIIPGVLYHHERIDGKGYPEGLKGEEIPLIGKIIGIADSFDAMTSKRVYRNAMTVEEALTKIREGLGKQFDEVVGRAFLESDVQSLWDAIQSGQTYAYDEQASDDEYGTLAIGALIR